MASNRFEFEFETDGNADIIDITDRVQDGLSEQEISEGVVTVFVPGATGALTTIEYEPGLVQDLKDLLEKLAPSSGNYNHDSHITAGNAYSHLKASLIGPSVSVPFENKRLSLGQWQQIMFLDCDNRPRRRRILAQVTG